ncbi:hypothetical protein V8C86DRAFT_2752057 [Haematococcus lacustris]
MLSCKGAASWPLRISKVSPRARLRRSCCQPHHASAPDVVQRVLQLIDGTDGGMAMPDAVKAEVDSLLDELEAVGRQQEPRPLASPMIWGNYCVAYTSTRRAPSERGSPSGGRFRGRLGRALFRTTGLFQSVLAPDIVTNKISWRLLGLLDGAVGLRGKLLPVGSTGDTVRVLFERPVLSLGGLHARIGPESEVQLATTYLDERVRIGKGSRGSLFVFTRGQAADKAGMELVGLQRTDPSALALLTAGFAALMLGGLALWLSPVPMMRPLAVGAWVLGALLGAVLRGGGIVQARQERMKTSTA